MSRSYRAVLITFLLFISPGCCTLAELWCGPDLSDWVQADFETPDATIKTFREALRRRAIVEIKNCLSEDCKRVTQLTGALEVSLAWERFEAKNPGIHLLGTAEISAPQPNPDGTVSYILERSGYQFEIVLTRQAYWEVSYYKEKDRPKTHLAGRYISEAEFEELLSISTEEIKEDGEVMAVTHSISAKTPVSEAIHRDKLGTKDLQRLSIGRNWKVHRFGPVEPEAQ